MFLTKQYGKHPKSLNKAMISLLCKWDSETTQRKLLQTNLGTKVQKSYLKISTEFRLIPFLLENGICYLSHMYSGNVKMGQD